MRRDISAFASLEEAREYARNAIDAAAGRARQRYITTTPGQEASYVAKYAQAQAYRDAGYPPDAVPYPWIAMEAAACGLSGAQAADRIIYLGDLWANQIGPGIEALRIGGKDAVTAATTVVEINALSAQTISALNGI